MQIKRSINEGSIPCSSAYKQETNPYYIVAPDYNHKSSGIRVLHELCSILNKFGYEAYVVTGKTNGDLWTPRLTEETKAAHYSSKKIPVVVYPEVVKGTPLNIGLPARYVLNYPGFLGGDKEYSSGEIVFSFMKEYYPSGIHLYIPVINISLLDSIEPKNKRKKGSCALYFNRNKPSDSEIKSYGEHCIEISPRKSYSYEEMISILKSVEILYCYESSNIVTEALLSGCAVVFIPNKNLIEIPEVFKNIGVEGIAWGLDGNGIEQAINTVHAKRKYLIYLISGWIDRLQNFIHVTQEASNKHAYLNAWPQDVVDTLLIQDQSTNEIAAKLDRKKYKNVNAQYRDWQKKSTLREIDADIYAEYITRGNLPKIAVVVHHDEGLSQELIADTVDSIDQNFYKAISVTIVSKMDPPDGFIQTAEIRWIKKEQLNTALNDNCGYDWVLTVESGVRLEPNALIEMALGAQSNVGAYLLYADEDICNKDGIYSFPNFKPDFNVELIRCSNYIGGSVLIERKIWVESGNPTISSEIYQLLLKYSLGKGARHIHHIDGMLFHGTGRVNALTENHEFEIARSTLLKSGIAKSVKPLDRLGTWLVEYESVSKKNTTLVVPTGIQPGYMRQLLESLAEYPCPNLAQILLVCNESDFEEVDFALQDLNIDVHTEIITYQATDYNHSRALNLAISKVNTEYVWVCDDDIEFIHPNTLGVLLSIAQQTDVGCVEPRLMSTHGGDARLASGPMVLGLQGGYAAYTGEMQMPEEFGYLSKLQLTQDVSAVNGHCFVFKSEYWSKVGGFDELNFSLKYSVLDYCLKLNNKGYRHVWAPLANAMHQGGRSVQKRLSDFEFKVAYAQKEVHERTKIVQVWGKELANDRFYNRHLSLISPYDVESNIVIDWNPHRKERPRVLASPLTSGAGQYRVIDPLEMLQNKGLVQSSVILPMADRKTRVLQPIELIRACPDTLILQHSVDDVQLSLIEQYKNALPQVYILQMVDDLLGFVPEKHPNRRFQSREGHLRMVEALKKSDSMVVTTVPLKDHYEKYIGKVKIVPNCLASQWFKLNPAKTKRNRLRVGWIGAGQHQGDLEIINEVIKNLAEKVDWIFMGMQTEEAKPYIKEFHPFVSISEYPEKMASLDLDIAIAPLQDNLFNRCKSNLRLLEYGVMGWPVVCSDVYAYQTNNPPVLRCGPNINDWTESLDRLIENEELRKIMGERLKGWVVNNYKLENSSEEWCNALIQNT
jgi:glycosyltransferase involved in cell wall biosynthesis